jgi:type IV secretory pathway VirB4 component
LRTRALEGLDLHHQPDLVNANLGVVASSGSGKSYLAGLVGLEAVRMGLRVVVIDPENEHRSWVEATGGRYLDLASELECGFNVLEMGDPEDAALGAVDLVNLLCGPLAPAESGSLMAALAALLDPGAGPRAVLGDCLGRLGADPAGRSLADRLRPWVQGRPGALFSRCGSGPAVDSVVGLGLRDLPPAWVPATTLLVSRWLWDWAKSEECPKQVIVDEAGLLADSPALQLLITHLARRIRKYQGSLMLLTQAAGDLVGGGAGEVVAINCATIMLGGQGPTGAHRLQRAFALDDGQRDWLQQAGRGSFLLVSGSRRSPIEVRAPELYHRLLTTRSGALGDVVQRTGGGSGNSVQD